MRCKKHYTDLSSTVGVCASCLREHLSSLIAAQEQSQSQSQSQNLDEKHRNFDNNPPFPRSVSPYINYHKSDHPWPNNNHHKDHHHHLHHHSLSDQLFYRTPQVGGGPTIGSHLHHNRKKNFMQWLSFPKIFRSRNRTSIDTVSVPEEQCVGGGGGGNATSSSPSPSSWFSNILHRKKNMNKNKKKNNNKPVYDDDESSVTTGRRQLHYCRDRGMSPVRKSTDESEFYDAVTSGYDSTTESMKQTPRRTPAHLAGIRRGGGGGHARSLSGLTFCLSPMVRASPNRQWSMPVADGGFSGEIRAPVKPHLANAKSFCANRSRKLADFGRNNPNR